MSTEQRPTVYVETYGCQMNVSDSELMLGKLSAAGYQPVDVPDGADVILINTCAIRDHAEQRVIGRLGELKRHMKADTVMGVTGCMATARCRSSSRARGRVNAPSPRASTSRSTTRTSRRGDSTR